MNNNKLSNFIQDLGLNPSEKELLSYVEIFISEMKNGLEKNDDNNCSLKMLPSYLNVNRLEKEDKCIVIDAGGTNLRVALLELNKNDYKLMSFKKTTLPGIEKSYSKDEFFEYIFDFIKDSLNDSDKIGFCFSYPMEIFPNKDGKLLRWTKEVKVPDAVNSIIGSELINIIKKKNHSEKRVILLNDTVACLFGGIGFSGKKDYDDYIGLIVGTGCNTAYIEDERNIKKLQTTSKNSKLQVINIESGNFDKVCFTEVDRLLHNETNDPNKQILEKMVSGRYLSRLMYYLLDIAISENIVSSEMEEISPLLNSSSTKEISEWINFGRHCNNNFANKLHKLNPTKEQISILSTIIKAIMNRATSLIAMKLASIIHKKKRGTLIHKPTSIIAEGSVIESFPYFKKYIEHHLSSILGKLGTYHYDIIHIDNSNIIGSGVAASLNID